MHPRGCKARTVGSPDSRARGHHDPETRTCQVRRSSRSAPKLPRNQLLGQFSIQTWVSRQVTVIGFASKGPDMGAECTGTTRIVWPFLKLVTRNDLLWAQLGLTEDGVADPEGRIAHHVLDLLLRAAIQSTGRPDLGLLAAQQLQPGDFDLLELVARSQPTLGEGIRCIPGLLPLLHDGWRLSVNEREGTTETRFDLGPGLPAHPAGYDFFMAAVMISIRRATGKQDLQATEVLLPYPEPRNRETYASIFDATLRFDQPYASLRFSSDTMCLRMVNASPSVCAALERVATELLSTANRPATFASQVAAKIGQLLSSGQPCKSSLVARKLGLTVRTLQRHLADEGTTFRLVLDEHRSQMARAYLGRPELSLAEISYLLGFSTSQAFHHAFKRWFDEF